jgi:hypothetical protein
MQQVAGREQERRSIRQVTVSPAAWTSSDSTTVGYARRADVVKRGQQDQPRSRRVTEICPDVVDRGARDASGVSSRLSGRRSLARGGKEAASMLKVVGNESAHDEVDGRSLLDEIAREGARRMLVAALENEVAEYLEAHGGERDDEGHALVVRNGKGRTRKITLGAGTIPVNAPRVNDRRTDPDGERRRFTSRILPPYMRRSPKVAEVLVVCHEHCPAHQRVGDGVPGLPEA